MFQVTKDEREPNERKDVSLDMKPSGQKCAALQGIVDEAEEVIGEAKDPSVLDAGMIAAAQAAGHYEIARYRTLIALGRTTGK